MPGRIRKGVVDVRAQSELEFGQAIALHRAGQVAQAGALYERVLKRQPDHADALHLLGVVALQNNTPRRAATLIARSIRINPDFAPAYSNLGLAQITLGLLDEALTSFDHAIALRPKAAEVHNNRGDILLQMRRWDDALASFEEAIRLDFECVGAHVNLAHLNLLLGNYSRGWREYEWRLRLGAAAVRNAPPDVSQWRGETPIAGRSILVRAEQGLGDTLQFCRYLPMLADLGAQVRLEVQAPLVDLLTSVDQRVSVMALGAQTRCELQCSIMSLPLAFGTELSTIPASSPYLSADSACVAKWQGILGQKSKPRVALVWAGNPDLKNDRNRSMPLSQLLRGLPDGCDYLSLQKDLRPGDGDHLRQHPEIRHLGPGLASFSDTAAICQLSDLTISVCTSVAHLAGALGKPVWLLLPRLPEWRWLLDRDRSPWYPSARLFRQHDAGDWSAVSGQIKEALGQLAAES